MVGAEKHWVDPGDEGKTELEGGEGVDSECLLWTWHKRQEILYKQIVVKGHLEITIGYELGYVGQPVQNIAGKDRGWTAEEKEKQNFSQGAVVY